MPQDDTTATVTATADHERLIATSVAAESACARIVRRSVLAGAVVGALAGGLFGFQAVLSEGLGAGIRFVLGVGAAGAAAGALLAAPPGILLGRARRSRLIRDSGFSPRQIEAAVERELGGAGPPA